MQDPKLLGAHVHQVTAEPFVKKVSAGLHLLYIFFYFSNWKVQNEILEIMQSSCEI